MSLEQDQFQIKFRLADGSDIGPISYSASMTVSTLKESIIAQWPEEKENGPRTVKDVRLISGGRVLEDNRPVTECMSPMYHNNKGITTMHAVVQQPFVEKEKKTTDDPQMNKCHCTIF